MISTTLADRGVRYPPSVFELLACGAFGVLRAGVGFLVLVRRPRSWDGGKPSLDVENKQFPTRLGLPRGVFDGYPVVMSFVGSALLRNDRPATDKAQTESFTLSSIARRIRHHVYRNLTRGLPSASSFVNTCLSTNLPPLPEVPPAIFG